jgi:tetratricopeptide (TPR) repeat protein
VNREEAMQSGMRQHQAGQLAAAETIYRQILHEEPNHADALQLLGIIAGQRGDADAAIDLFRQSIQLRPEHPGPYRNLAPLLAKKGLLDEAIAAYKKFLELRPDSPEIHRDLGDALKECGRLDEAIAAYTRAITLKSDFAAAYFNLGQAYRIAARPGEALAAYQKAIKIDRTSAEVHASMAAVFAELNRFDEAMSSHAELAMLKPEAAITHEVLGKIMLERQDARAAASHFRRALAIDSNLDMAWHGLGISLQSQGEFDEAAKCFRRMLEICPRAGAGVIYRHLFETGSGAITAADIEQVKTFLDEPNIPAVSRLAAGFALGKVLDEAGQFDEAFIQYSQANSLVKQLRNSVGEIYDPVAVHRLNEQMMEVFTRAYFEERQDWGDRTELPVFIVGMPRSGTTLVQQIAASHPQVHGAGELSDMADITRSLGGTDVKSAAHGWTRDAIDVPAQRHIQRLRALDENALRVIDKMPSNVHRLGLIALLFPSARVIFCSRDARDTCLSCYFQWFAMGNTFSFDLAHCGHEHLATEKLMSHWRTVLPLRILDVQYEELVADLEGQSRRLIDFLGLPWDPACLEFHRTQTTILTASSWQVRQPIYQRSVDRWRHYERHLEPLLTALGG